MTGAEFVFALAVGFVGLGAVYCGILAIVYRALKK